MIKPERNHKDVTSTTVQQQSGKETASTKGQKNGIKGREPKVEIRTGKMCRRKKIVWSNEIKFTQIMSNTRVSFFRIIFAPNL